MEEFIDDLQKLEHSELLRTSSSRGNTKTAQLNPGSAATLAPLDPDHVDQLIGFSTTTNMSGVFINLNHDEQLPMIPMANSHTNLDQLHNNQSSFYTLPPPPYDPAAVAHHDQVVAHDQSMTSLSSSLLPAPGFGIETCKNPSMGAIMTAAGYLESSSSRDSGSHDQQLINGRSKAADRNNNKKKKKKGSGGGRKRKSNNDSAVLLEKLPAHEQVIHVRAKRGQATDSHSLAERVRRERINEKLRVLQDLVPGCYKTMGMAAVLDVIINYVQSLQNQIEFLSMKLSAASMFYDFNSPEAEAIEALQKASGTREALTDMQSWMVREGTSEGPFPHPHLQMSSWHSFNN